MSGLLNHYVPSFPEFARQILGESRLPSCWIALESRSDSGKDGKSGRGHE